MEELNSQDYELDAVASDAAEQEITALEEAPVQQRREAFMPNTATIVCAEYVCHPSL
jgi:hypothetical protein